MTQQTKRRSTKITAYRGTTLARVYDKESGACLGYLAEPEQRYDENGTVIPWYQITCDNHGEWHCTCDGNAKWHRECKHIRAAQESCKSRVERGLPGCFQGKAEAGVETEERQAEQSAYDLVADLIDPQLPEPAQSPEEIAAAAREELAALEAQLEAVRAKQIQAEREEAAKAAIASDVITNGSIDHAQERVEAAKKIEAAPLTKNRQGFAAAVFGCDPEMQRRFEERQRAS